MFRDMNEDKSLDVSYNLDFMEMDGTFKNNIEIPLTFTYGAEPESISNVNEYKGDGPAIQPSALNQF